MRMFQVGGSVRDEILGLPSKDIDFTVVLDDADMAFTNNDPFRVMVLNLQGMGFKVFLETPEFLTVRAQFPKKEVRTNNPAINALAFANAGLTADFVLARKESDYTDGRRPDHVEPGTLLDDLKRRDFTINAIARDLETGQLIDPFSGREDIKNGIIRAVGDPYERLKEDALRTVRALRFAVTKGFTIEQDLAWAIGSISVLDRLERISSERIREEVGKMFKHDTIASIVLLNSFPSVMRVIFGDDVWLEASMKQRPQVISANQVRKMKGLPEL